MASNNTREMKVTQEEMAEAKIPLHLRDYCAHLFIPLMNCRKETYYLPWKCKRERHEWEECEYEDFMHRVRKKRSQQVEGNKTDS